MTTAEASAAPASAPSARREGAAGRGGRVALPLFSPGLDSLPHSRAGAVAARELRYTWREPRRRVQLLGGVLVPFLLLAGVLSDGGLHRHRIVFAALLVAFLAGNNRAINQFGMDGPAFWIHESAGQDLRADLTGKNLAVAVTTLPLAALTAVVLAAISGGWAELAMTIGLSVGLMGLLLGAGDVASVLLPIPLTDAAGNLWATQGGQGCAQGMLSLLVLGLDAVLAAPTVVPALLVHGVVTRVAVVAFALVYGAVLYRIGLAAAVRFGRSRGPELLEAIGPHRGP
jgi:ABC-2 type transport system permease protein